MDNYSQPPSQKKQGSATQPLLRVKTDNKNIDRCIKQGARFVSWFQAVPAVAHFIRAGERFNDRMVASLVRPLPISLSSR